MCLSWKNGRGTKELVPRYFVSGGKNMKNKKLILIAVAVIALIGVMLGVYFATRPETTQGGKTFTVTVVHKDGSEKVFTCHTDEEKLGPVLLTEKIVEGSMGDFGLYILSADGEVADYNVDQGWWALYEGENMASTGADAVAITDGGSYKLVYTIG
jgi:hypothetical protein